MRHLGIDFLNIYMLVLVLALHLLWRVRQAVAVQAYRQVLRKIYSTAIQAR